jgi:hypothetical protein
MKRNGGSKTNVMLALLAVLLISLGYLSTQSVKEGLTLNNKTCPSWEEYSEEEKKCVKKNK